MYKWAFAKACLISCASSIGSFFRTSISWIFLAAHMYCITSMTFAPLSVSLLGKVKAKLTSGRRTSRSVPIVFSSLIETLGVRTKSWTKQRPQGGNRYIVHIRKESPRPAIIWANPFCNWDNTHPGLPRTSNAVSMDLRERATRESQIDQTRGKYTRSSAASIGWGKTTGASPLLWTRGM